MTFRALGESRAREPVTARDRLQEVLPGDPTVVTLLERITRLETALIEAQSTAAASSARAALAQRELAAVSPPPPPAPPQVGRRSWLRRSDPPAPNYRGLDRHVDQLLSLAEEQAEDILAAARHEADQIRATAVDDAAKIRAASL